MKDTIKRNLLQIKRKIEPYTPNIIAVTKYFDHTAIIESYNAGIRDFGENRVLDAVAKIELLDDEIRKNSRFHLIGHLQKNKVKKAVGNFDLIQSVDTLELAQAIDAEAVKKEIKQKVLIQINNAKEPQKSGFYPEEILEVFGDLLKLQNIEIKGLMNMAPMIEDREEILRLFKEIAELKMQLENKFQIQLDELSMGMSGDYELAAQAGATIIRIGRVLFNK
ncbi:YggS family pyridoxal phosphate-dependent enzyme [bacterium]|nr:YggS family pyridoxal phosphate-dependent enzyme [bacterium]